MTSPCDSCPVGTGWFGGACVLRPKPFTSASLLHRPADDGRVAYVREGWVELTCGGQGTAESTATWVPPGGWVGLGALAAAGADLTVWTLSAGVLCDGSARAVSRWLDTHPDHLRAAFHDLVLLDRACVAMQKLQRGRPSARLARFLLAPVIPTYHPATAARTLPRRTLARMLAMRPETLSRTITGLVRRGVLDARRGLGVADAEALADLAEDDEPSPELSPRRRSRVSGS